jgi:hypothetical protein
MSTTQIMSRLKKKKKHAKPKRNESNVINSESALDV